MRAVWNSLVGSRSIRGSRYGYLCPHRGATEAIDEGCKLLYMVLIVDNDSLVMRPWISILREEGYDVELRNHADRALETAKERAAELQCAIVDVMMPAPAEWVLEDTMEGLMTGYVLAEKFREIAPNLPIIFLSANIDQAVIGKLRRFPPPSDCMLKLRLNEQLLLGALSRLVKPAVALA